MLLLNDLKFTHSQVFFFSCTTHLELPTLNFRSCLYTTKLKSLLKPFPLCHRFSKTNLVVSFLVRLLLVYCSLNTQQGRYVRIISLYYDYYRYYYYYLLYYLKLTNVKV